MAGKPKHVWFDQIVCRLDRVEFDRELADPPTVTVARGKGVIKKASGWKWVQDVLPPKPLPRVLPPLGTPAWNRIELPEGYVVKPDGRRPPRLSVKTDRKCLVEDDIAGIRSQPIDYISPPYVLPGQGYFVIRNLLPNQLARATTSNGKRVVLKGGIFSASFRVTEPARQPTPDGPKWDPLLLKNKGSGRFILKNPARAKWGG